MPGVSLEELENRLGNKLTCEPILLLDRKLSVDMV